MLKQSTQIHQNIMEILVRDEVKKQLQTYPPNLVEYIEPIEVETFALNRLPAMYASSLKGKRQQEIKAKRRYRKDIEKAVRQAIAAVTRDPLRKSDPLPIPVSNTSSNSDPEANQILKELEQFLQERDLLLYKNLTWVNLIDSIQYIIDQSSQSYITPQRKQETVDKFKAWQERQRKSPKYNLGDWGDNRYN